MSKTSFHILRVGSAITFLWIGILILKQPEAWMGYIAPWAANLLPMPIEQMMQGTAILDILIGALLLFDIWVWPAALLGSIHLVIVLGVSGITDITVRDIGILAATIALAVETTPKSLIIRLKKKKYE